MSLPSNISRRGWPVLFTLLLGLQLLPAQDKIFSGPQVGEKTTPFPVLDIRAPEEKERNPVTENKGAPTVIVFVQQIERSLVPVLRGIDTYGTQRKDKIKTEFVFLSPDRLAGVQRAKAASGSLQMKSNLGVSTDGAEGPGNYGLNKECMLTIISAKDNTVTANFALVQPGVADLPKIIEALAKTCGDTAPPSIQQLTALPEGAGARMRAANAQSSDAAKPKEDFPGAVPSDPQLQSMLRQFIRPTNDDATVDRLLGEVKTYIKDNPDLKKQAIDGWVRVLHFGDRYGTAYSRKVGQAFLEELKKG